MSIAWRDYSANFRRITDLLIQSEADISIFPEAAVSGFPYDDLPLISGINHELLTETSQICRNHQRAAVLPALIQEDQFFFNRTFFINRNGDITAFYNKIHLIGVLNEDRYLTPGNRTVTVDFTHPEHPHISKKIGLATCYDLRFPELFRELTLNQKADLILLPAFWPKARKEHFRPLLQARAIENQIPLVACNACGKWGKMELCGDSAAFNAKGTLISSLEDQEGVVDFYWDFSETEDWRIKFPALKDARLFSGIRI